MIETEAEGVLKARAGVIISLLKDAEEQLDAIAKELQWELM